MERSAFERLCTFIQGSEAAIATLISIYIGFKVPGAKHRKKREEKRYLSLLNL